VRGFVVSKGGTFGVVHRCYRNEDGEPMVVIRWGPLGWLTPCFQRDVLDLSSSFESEARKEAEEWLANVA
jgi:hypothetical protein